MQASTSEVLTLVGSADTRNPHTRLLPRYKLYYTPFGLSAPAGPTRPYAPHGYPVCGFSLLIASGICSQTGRGIGLCQVVTGSSH